MSVQDRCPTYQADQRDFFDAKVTEDWSEYSDPRALALWRFETDLLLRYVRPATILDLGCGAGFHDREMARRPFVRRILAVDYSERSIERACEHFADLKIRYEASDFLQLPPSPDPFDLVVSFQVIEHLEDPDGFLRLCRRQCRLGGQVAVFTSNRLRPYNRRRIGRGKEPVLEDTMHRREFDRRELAAMGRRCGLRPWRVFGYGVAPAWRWRRLGLWAGYWCPWLSDRLGALYEVGAEGAAQDATPK